MEDREKIDALDDLVAKLTDVQHSYQALIEKMAHLQMETDELEPDLADKLQPAFDNASRDHETLTSVIQDIQFEVNRLRA